MDKPALPGDVEDLVITYTSRQDALQSEDERYLHKWYVEIQAIDDSGNPTHQVGHAVAHTVSFVEIANPFLLLDGEHADLGHIAGVLFDVTTGELDQDLEDQIEAFGDGVLIIDSVQLEPAWRGHGLGPLVVGLVIEQLGEGRQFVALQAAPTERRNNAGDVVNEITDDDRNDAVEKLGKLWALLGFEFFKDEVWILDLGSVTFADRMKSIRRTVGLG